MTPLSTTITIGPNRCSSKTKKPLNGTITMTGIMMSTTTMTSTSIMMTTTTGRTTPPTRTTTIIMTHGTMTHGTTTPGIITTGNKAKQPLRGTQGTMTLTTGE